MTKAQINKGHVPKHVAIIMDGTTLGKRERMNRVFGHRNALNAIRETVE